MALDRQTIARRDFPTGPRGYDPAAVDAHLAAVAAQVEELHRRAGRDAPPADPTTEQAHAIIEAAERSADGIREAATAQAHEHVARAAEAADRLREHIDALAHELTGTLAGLRARAERLHRDLETTAAAAAQLAAPGAAPGGAAGERVAQIAPSARGATLGATPDEIEEEVGDEPALAAVAEAPERKRRDDVVAARIVALEMAMSGRPRHETDRFLAEHYDLPERAALLDDVYAHASG